MILKSLSLLAIFLFANIKLFSQVQDNFNDGDLYHNPGWHGDLHLFNTENGLLRSAGNPRTDTIYLSTAVSQYKTQEWYLTTSLDFAPSGSNKLRFYLWADSINLLYSANAMYLEIGQSGDDDFKLIQEKDGIKETILESTKIYTTEVEETLKLVLEENVNWSLYLTNADFDLIKDAAGVSIPMEFQEKVYSGIVCFHTSTRKDKFYFDDYYSGPVVQDTIAPKASSLKVLNDRELELGFSEVVEEPLFSDFQLNDSIHPESFEIDSKALKVTFSENFGEGKNSLKLKNIQDKSGNRLVDTTLHFKYYPISDPVPGDVVVNEIMADPSPPVDLPEVEYLELWNVAEKNFDLSTFYINGKAITSEKQLLLKDSFVILCKMDDVPLLEPYGFVVGMKSWDILSNSGDDVVLSHDSTILDAVSYTDHWYKNSKVEGGISLERQYEIFPCSEEFNWKASAHQEGGSPGEANSNNNHQDLQPPSIERALAIDSTLLQIQFSEALNIHSFQLKDISSEKLTFIDYRFLNDDLLEVMIIKPLTPSVEYDLKIKEVADCYGNLVLEDGFSVVYPEAIDSGDIKINELLFDPYPSGVDFLEIVNTTSKFLNLENLIISTDSSDNHYVFAEYLILRPNQHLALTTDITKTISDYPKAKNLTYVSYLPPMPNDQGDIYLHKGSLLLDHFYYSSDLHLKFLEVTEGVSLERISPYKATNVTDNWHSAASSVGYATPGYKNSQSSENLTLEDPLGVSAPYLTPNQDGDKDYVEILYSFSTPGNIATIDIFSPRGNRIKSVANNAILANEGSFIWYGDTDSGALAGTGHYIIIAQIFDINGETFIFREKVAVVQGAMR